MELQDKLIILLADQDVTEREFNSFCKWLSSGGVEDIIYKAGRVRDILRDKNTASTKRPVNQATKNYPEVTSEKQRLLDELTRLLITEARMSKRSAVLELAKEFRLESVIPERIAFESALSRITDIVPPSLVLHVAQRIRNLRVHSSTSPDWPLKGGEDETVE